MHKLKFTLKQHTPLIHFQHDQEGATLRASEVKPKLDRFILTRLGNGDYDVGKQKAKDNGWLVGKGEHGALDYKMRIKSIDETYSKKIEYKQKDGKWRPDFPFIFGNVETEEEQKVFRFCNTQNLEIHLCDEYLKKEISNTINSFFAKTNFGFRQNKGFGSFFPLYKVENSDQRMTISDYEKALKEGNLIKIFAKKYDLLADSNEFEKMKQLFKMIDKEYKILKSGFNKAPSKLREYCKKNYSLEWEKESIKKEKIVDNERYLRVLLGLADHFEYTNKKKNVEIEHICTDNKDKIERFQSPLTFKIFENAVYILYPKKMVDNILNQEFRFTLNDVSDKRNPVKIKELKLFTVKTNDNISPNFYYEFLNDKLKWKIL